MSALLIAAVAFCLSQLVLSLLLLWRAPYRGLRERLFAGLLLAVAGYLVLPLAAGSRLEWVAATVQTAVPGMFWLFSASVFDDHFRLRRWQVTLVGITVLVPLLGRLLDVGWEWLFFTLPQALEFVLLGLTLWVVAQHWRTDLVEARRRLRVWFVGINGCYLLLLLLSREILFPGEAWLATWQYVPLGALLLAINAMLLQYRTDLLFKVDAPAPVVAETAAPAEPVDPALVARLQDYMTAQLAWREMGLTLGQLAAALDVPQYRLRRAINAGMGYRNFNDFLNTFRVEEAARRLADPGESHLPVLTIAMDAGFRSMSSFNTAFKASRGITPSEWRRAHKK